METLIWLGENNLLYKDIDINYTLLDNWDDKFILTGIMSCVLQCGADFDEREKYAANFEIDNSQNELHHVVNDASLNAFGLLNGYLYTDADDA